MLSLLVKYLLCSTENLNRNNSKTGLNLWEILKIAQGFILFVICTSILSNEGKVTDGINEFLSSFWLLKLTPFSLSAPGETNLYFAAKDWLKRTFLST